MPFTLLHPWFAVAGLAAAGAVIIAHMIWARTRAPAPLPTTRFVPRLQERSAALERRPRDILLLLLRAGALAVIGLALAAPVTAPRVGPMVRIAVADVAGSADPGATVARAREIAGASGRVVVSDTGAVLIDAGDAGYSAPAAAAPLSLSAALVRSIREAAALGARGHPVAISIVSGFPRGAVDSATGTVRALWPGTIQLVDVPPPSSPVERGVVSIRGNEDDPLRATAALLASGSGRPAVIVREAWTDSDSAAAAAGAAVVHWPREGVPASFVTRAAVDTVGGVWVDGYAFVARFGRDAVLAVDDGARVMARWLDGSPAAVERALEEGCVREVAVRVPDIGDLSISPGFRRVAEALTGPCGGARDATPVDGARRAMLQGEGPSEVTLATASSSLLRSRLAAPLLLVALLALLAETFLRRRR
ncbi:MAG TPA: BatA domain-containing protein [Gemmatimonadaceae bacterium]